MNYCDVTFSAFAKAVLQRKNAWALEIVRQKDNLASDRNNERTSLDLGRAMLNKNGDKRNVFGESFGHSSSSET